MINLQDYKTKLLLTKEELLKYITDYDVFKYYVGEFSLGTPILSPLRKEDKPSFNIFYSRKYGILLFKDFRGQQGDFIVFVQRLFNLGYYEAMSQIAMDFSLNDKYLCKGYISHSIKTLPSFGIKIREEEKTKTKEITIRIRNWTKTDIQFWNTFGISMKTLKFYRVLPISHYLINKSIFITDKLAFAFVEEKDDRMTFKIYQPFSKYWKWINSHNNSIHQGYIQLPTGGPLLIITKALKDVMSLYEVANIYSIGIQSENYLIKESVMDEYKSRFHNIISLFDWDTAGKLCTEKYEKAFKINSIFIPEEFESKDFSDLVKNTGKKNALDIIKKLIYY